MEQKRYQSIHPDYEWAGENDFDNNSLPHAQIVHSQNLLFPQTTQILRGSRLISGYRPNVVYSGNYVTNHISKRSYSTAQPDYSWQETNQVIAPLRGTMYTRTAAPLVTYTGNPYLARNQVILQNQRTGTPLRRSNTVVVNQLNPVITNAGLRSSGYIKQSGPVQIIGNNSSVLRRSHMDIRGSYTTTAVSTGNAIRSSHLTALRGSNHGVTRVVHNPGTTILRGSNHAVLRGSQHGVTRVVHAPQTLTVQQGDALRGSNMVVRTTGGVPTIEQLRGSRHVQHMNNLDAQVENLNNELRGSKYRASPPPPAE